MIMGSTDAPGGAVPQPDLPHHVLQHVFQFLPDKLYLVHMMLVCKSWRAAAADPDLWKNVTIELFKADHMHPPSYAGGIKVVSAAGASAFVTWLTRRTNEAAESARLRGVDRVCRREPVNTESACFRGSVDGVCRGEQVSAESACRTGCALQHLTSLDMGGNGSLLEVQACLSVLPALQGLAVSSTDSNLKPITTLSSLPATLYILHLSHMPITCSAVQGLASLTNLQQLSLRACNLDDNGLLHIALLTQLTQLDLTYNSICYTDVSRPCVTSHGLQAISTLTKMKVLSIGQRPNVFKEFQELANFSFLSGMTGLQKLHAGYHALSHDSLQPLACLPLVTEVKVDSCWFGHPGTLLPLLRLHKLNTLVLADVSTICPRLAVGLSMLTNLSHLDISSKAAFAFDMGLKLAPLVQLHTLKIGNSSLDVPNVQHLTGLTALEYLDVSYSCIDLGVMQVVQTLTRLTRLVMTGMIFVRGDVQLDLGPLVNLRVLDVSDSGMDAAAVKRLSSLTALEDLDIGYQGIGPLGLLYLSALTNLTNLKVAYAGLDVHKHFHSSWRLWSNVHVQQGLHPVGAAILSLSVLRELRSLMISGQNLAGSGVVQCLTALTTLHHLDVTHTGVKKDVARQLQAAMPKLRELEWESKMPPWGWQ